MYRERAGPAGPVGQIALLPPFGGQPSISELFRTDCRHRFWTSLGRLLVQSALRGAKRKGPPSALQGQEKRATVSFHEQKGEGSERHWRAQRAGPGRGVSGVRAQRAGPGRGASGLRAQRAGLGGWFRIARAARGAGQGVSGVRAQRAGPGGASAREARGSRFRLGLGRAEGGERGVARAARGGERGKGRGGGKARHCSMWLTAVWAPSPGSAPEGKDAVRPSRTSPGPRACVLRSEGAGLREGGVVSKEQLECLRV
jgi:hypothetical protein